MIWSVHTSMQGVSLGPVVFSQADQDVRGGIVLVPGRVEDAVSCSEDPLIADQTGSTQQLLGVAFIQHHLPAKRSKKRNQFALQHHIQKTWLPRRQLTVS